VYRALIGGVPDAGGTYASSPPFMPSGARSACPHLTWNDEPFEEGSITPMELVASRLRYHMPLGRTVYLGDPPQRLLDVASAVVDGLGETLDTVRPGVTAGEVAAVFHRRLERSGIEKDSRLGYSIGIAYPPTFGERTVSLRPGDRTVLQPNMTMHIIPGIWLDGMGLEITEPFLVTETGAETFCSWPRELVVKP